MSSISGRSLSSSGLHRAYEQRFVAHCSDIFRVVALLLVIVAWFVSGVASAAAMALVAGGTWMLRYYASTRLLDVLGQLVFLVAGACSVFGFYKHLWWLDLVVHFTVMVVVTMVIHEAMAHRSMVRKKNGAERKRPHRASVVIYGVLAMILWEAGEWIGYHCISQEIGVGIMDTATDVLMGALGVGLAHWNLSRRKIL